MFAFERPDDLTPVLRDFIEKIDALIYMIDHELPDGVFEKAPDFFRGVRETAVGIGKSVVAYQGFTARQEAAITNSTRGVRNWIRD